MAEARPQDLPDYENPPINEVAFGIQFEPPAGYQQAYVTEVWNLYRREFPKVQEIEPLAPNFETFGLPGAQQRSFEIKAGPTHDRFWFLAEDEIELIQFQADRLLHNWRKSKSGNNPYPRFEQILPKFEQEAQKLDSYFSEKFSSPLKINQCELSYINLININEQDKPISNWLHMTGGVEDFDNFTINTRKVLTSDSGEPYARLHCLCRTVYDPKKNFLVYLEFTVRGIPGSTGIPAALEFFKNARRTIVLSFDQMTTEYADSKWGKK